jgi:hypothetical protein
MKISLYAGSPLPFGNSCKGSVSEESARLPNYNTWMRYYTGLVMKLMAVYRLL